MVIDIDDVLVDFDDFFFDLNYNITLVVHLCFNDNSFFILVNDLILIFFVFLINYCLLNSFFVEVFFFVFVNFFLIDDDLVFNFILFE